tara:strand:+ start:297 stop:446 length:150 start_codon:yes stop_codon:yes gene_type:complete
MKNSKEEKQKYCTACNCKITQDDFDKHKLCSWCYAQIILGKDFGYTGIM